MVGTILSILGTLAATAIGAAQATKTREANQKQVEQTNATNLQLAREANAAQAAESEKAYQRTMPSNQVGQLRAAGMSKAGAINTLNGGASYTPAAVNTAQVQAYQEDASDMTNVIGNLTNVSQAIQQYQQLKENKRQYNSSLQQQKEELQHQKDMDNHRKNMEEQANDRAAQEAARQQYDHDMSKLSNDMQNKAVEVMRLANPADYKTPYDYVQALRDKADDKDKSLFDNAQFVRTIESKHAVDANARNTEARTTQVISATQISSAVATMQEEKHREEMKLIRQQYGHNEVINKSLEEKAQKDVEQVIAQISYDKSEHSLLMAKEKLEMTYGMKIDILKSKVQDALHLHDEAASQGISYGRAWYDYTDSVKELDNALGDYLTQLNAAIEEIEKAEGSK